MCESAITLWLVTIIEKIIVIR